MKDSDSMVVNDGSGRRRFIRVGAAFLLAQGAVAKAQDDDTQNFRTDCDSQGYGGQKNAEAAGNDSDSGASADRPGCGRKLPLTQYDKRKEGRVRVVKIKA